MTQTQTLAHIADSAVAMYDQTLPLYYCDADSPSPRGAYVWVDARDGRYGAEIASGDGSVSMDVYHGHIRYIGGIEPSITGDGLRDLLTDIAPYVQRVIDAYTPVYDGDRVVARYTDDFADACYEIERVCESARDCYDDTQIHDVDVYMSVSRHEVAQMRADGMTDHQIAHDIITHAAGDGIVLVDRTAMGVSDLAAWIEREMPRVRYYRASDDVESV